MNTAVLLLLMVLVGIIIGVAICWFFLSGKLDENKLLQESYQKELALRAAADERGKFLEQLEIQVKTKSQELKKLYESNGELKTELAKNIESALQTKENAEKRLIEVKEAHQKLAESFSVLSSQALVKNNEAFLSVAKSTFEKWQSSSNNDLQKRETTINEFVTPLKVTLEKMDKKVSELEVSREGAYKAMHQQITSLVDTQNLLRKETNNLSQALHAPISRGRWGEMQLKRVVELAGMTAHCDFEEQTTILSQEKEYRPDLVVKLPGNRNLVVDAKMPLDSYLKAVESQDDQDKKKFMSAHAEQTKRHIQALSKKAYWKKIQPTPEFVILFLPGEAFFGAALEQDPKIIELGVDQGVIVATPTTLIALLKAIAYGWKQENLSENASKITQMAQVLCERIDKMTQHFHKLGRNISGTVDAYNQTLGSLETRVLSTARKLENLGQKQEVAKKSTLSTVDKLTRMPKAIEELSSP